MVHSARILIALVLLLASCFAFASAPININTADEQTLSAELTGVGPVKAKAIVAYREQNGSFKTVDDLVNVKGIGQKTLDQNREKVTIGAKQKK